MKHGGMHAWHTQTFSALPCIKQHALSPQKLSLQVPSARESVSSLERDQSFSLRSDTVAGLTRPQYSLDIPRVDLPRATSEPWTRNDCYLAASSLARSEHSHLAATLANCLSSLRERDRSQHRLPSLRERDGTRVVDLYAQVNQRSSIPWTPAEHDFTGGSYGGDHLENDWGDHPVIPIHTRVASQSPYAQLAPPIRPSLSLSQRTPHPTEEQVRYHLKCISHYVLHRAVATHKAL